MNILTLMLTDSCNCQCVYCYQRVLKSNSVGNWKINQIEKLKDILLNIDAIHFFGGEPLLEEEFIINLDKYINDLFKKKKLFQKPIYIFSSNLTYLSKKFKKFLIKLKKEEHAFKFIISIDGKKEIHDINRKISENLSSYELILENNKFLQENNIELDSIVSVYNKKHLENNCSILQPVFDITKNFPNTKFVQFNYEECISGLSIEKNLFFKTQLSAIEEVFQMIVNKETRVIHYKHFLRKFLNDIYFSLCHIQLKDYMCLNKKNKIAIFPNGDVYTCVDEYYLKVPPFKNINISSDKKAELILKGSNCSSCKYDVICHICPIKQDEYQEECERKKEFFRIFEKNLKEIFSNVKTTYFFKKYLDISAITLKELYLYFREI